MENLANLKLACKGYLWIKMFWREDSSQLAAFVSGEMLKYIGQFTYFNVLLKLDENVLSYTKADKKIVKPSVENRECALCRLVNRC